MRQLGGRCWSVVLARVAIDCFLFIAFFLFASDGFIFFRQGWSLLCSVPSVLEIYFFVRFRRFGRKWLLIAKSCCIHICFGGSSASQASSRLYKSLERWFLTCIPSTYHSCSEDGLLHFRLDHCQVSPFSSSSFVFECISYLVT